MSKSAGIALTYCGAVIGAGFATGREVVDFFSVYGRQALPGIVLASVLFIWVGIVILDITHRYKVYSYIDLLQHILPNKGLVFVVDCVFLVTLLAGVGVMTAAGATVLNSWGIWYPAASFIFLGVSLLLLRSGSQGFVKANSWLVPGLVVAISLLCILQISVPTTVSLHPGPIASGVLYVAFNTAMAAVALTTLKGQLDQRSIMWGGLGGGLLIATLLFLVYQATVGMGAFPEIPMLVLAQTWLGQLEGVFPAILLAAVLTTALANLHGLASRIGGDGGYWYWAAGIAGAGFVVAQYGFAPLVGLLYPLLGLCNVVLLLGLCYYSFNRIKFRSR